MAVLLRHSVPGLPQHSTRYDSILIKKKLIRRCFICLFVYWLRHCLGLSLSYLQTIVSPTSASIMVDFQVSATTSNSRPGYLQGWRKRGKVLRASPTSASSKDMCHFQPEIVWNDIKDSLNDMAALASTLCLRWHRSSEGSKGNELWFGLLYKAANTLPTLLSRSVHTTLLKDTMWTLQPDPGTVGQRMTSSCTPVFSLLLWYHNYPSQGSQKYFSSTPLILALNPVRMQVGIRITRRQQTTRWAIKAHDSKQTCDRGWRAFRASVGTHQPSWNDQAGVLKRVSFAQPACHRNGIEQMSRIQNTQRLL